MVDVDEYLKTAGGNFLRAQHVQNGDRLLILDEGTVDDQSFKDKQGRPRAYLVFNVKLQRTGEDYLLRLGPRNTKRVRESFGTSDTSKWKGRLLEIIGIEEYPGLQAKGILLRGCAPSGASGTSAQPKGVQLNVETIDFIRKSRDIIDACIPLNESDFNVLPAGVRAQLLKYGLVEKQVQGDVTQYSFKEKQCKPFLA